MKAISLWQPWASAIALGLKRIETRHWSTTYRGRIAIHAALRWDRRQREFAETERTLGRLHAKLSFGAVVAIARLVSVQRTDELASELTPIERLYGDYAPGRFGWLLADIQRIEQPVPYRGHQGLFNVPDELLAVPMTWPL
jgi:hypothetical protein